jgi:hypothetical protein
MLSSSFKALDEFAGAEGTVDMLSGTIRAVAAAENIAGTVAGIDGRTGLGELMVSAKTETAAAVVLMAVGTTGTEGPRFTPFGGGVCGTDSGLLSSEAVSSA